MSRLLRGTNSSMKGCKRFLDRVWNLQNMLVRGDEYSDELRASMHKTIKKVSEDIEKMKIQHGYRRYDVAYQRDYRKRQD